MEDVRDLPLWEDFPLASLIPAPIEVRRGMAHGLDTVALWHPAHEVQCTLSPSNLSRENLEAAVGNIGGWIFEKENGPSAFPRMIRMEAECVVNGRQVPDEITRLKQRYKELTSLAA